jgi:hypothetical protein
MTLPKWDLSEVTPEKGFAENDKDHLDSIIWVGASTPTDTKWPSSAYGPNIDLFAPGEFIRSAKNESDTASQAPGGVMGGTSDVSHEIDSKNTLIATNSTKLHRTLRRLPTSLESSRVCSATLAIGTFLQGR